MAFLTGRRRRGILAAAIRLSIERAQTAHTAPPPAHDGSERSCRTIGAPGATQIAMGVLQACLNVIDFGMSMTEAVSAPRFSSTSDAIDLSNRIGFRVERELQAMGYDTVRDAQTFGFAAVHGIRIEDDRLDGGADPGHDGTAMRVPASG